MEFVPPNKRTDEYFKSVFEAADLADIVKLHKAQASQEAKRDLQQLLVDDLADNKPIKDIVSDLKEVSQRNNIPEHEVIGLVKLQSDYFSNILNKSFTTFNDISFRFGM